MHGNQIPQLAREDGADRLLLPRRQPFQCDHLHPRKANFQIGEPHQLRNGLRHIRAEGLLDRLLRPEDIERGVRNTGVWSLLLICKALALPPAALFEDFTASVLRRLSR